MLKIIAVLSASDCDLLTHDATIGASQRANEDYQSELSCSMLVRAIFCLIISYFFSIATLAGSEPLKLDETSVSSMRKLFEGLCSS